MGQNCHIQHSLGGPIADNYAKPKNDNMAILTKAGNGSSLFPRVSLSFKLLNWSQYHWDHLTSLKPVCVYTQQIFTRLVESQGTCELDI